MYSKRGVNKKRLGIGIGAGVLILLVVVAAVLLLSGKKENAQLAEGKGKSKYQVSSENRSSISVMAEEYLKIIDKSPIAHNQNRFALIYVDEDNIPELVADNPGFGFSLYTFDGEKAVTIIDYAGYGAFGIAGYEYSPYNNIISVGDADEAGAVYNEYWFKITENGLEDYLEYPLVSVYESGCWGYDCEDADWDNPCYYYGDAQITEEEYQAYADKIPEGEYEYIEGTKTAFEMREELHALLGEMPKSHTDEKVEQIKDWYYQAQEIAKDSVKLGGQSDETPAEVRGKTGIWGSEPQYGDNYRGYYSADFDGIYEYPFKVYLDVECLYWDYEREYYFRDGELYFAAVYLYEDEMHLLYFSEGKLIRYVDENGEVYELGSDSRKSTADFSLGKGTELAEKVLKEAYVVREALKHSWEEISEEDIIKENEEALQAYQEFLNGERGAYIDEKTDSRCKFGKRGTEYYLFDVAGRAWSGWHFTFDWRESTDTGDGIDEIRYAYMDCGNDGFQELAIQFYGMDMNERGDDSTSTYILTYEDDKLCIRYGFECRRHTNTDLNYYGRIIGNHNYEDEIYEADYDKAGDYGVLNENVDYVFISGYRECSLTYAPEVFEYMKDIFDSISIIEGCGYEADYRSQLHIWGGWTHGKTYCRYSFSGDMSELSEEDATALEKLKNSTYKFYTEEEIQEIIRQREKELNIDDVVLSDKELEWITLYQY